LVTIQASALGPFHERVAANAIAISAAGPTTFPGAEGITSAGHGSPALRREVSITELPFRPKDLQRRRGGRWVGAHALRRPADLRRFCAT
jgi:hypothetical protein